MRENPEEHLAEEVSSILESAESRREPEGEIDVETRPLNEALDEARTAGRAPVISEIKPTSPTTEEVKGDNPARLARKMEDAGATALSILTEEEHFEGGP